MAEGHRRPVVGPPLRLTLTLAPAGSPSRPRPPLRSGCYCVAALTWPPRLVAFSGHEPSGADHTDPAA